MEKTIIELNSNDASKVEIPLGETGNKNVSANFSNHAPNDELPSGEMGKTSADLSNDTLNVESPSGEIGKKNVNDDLSSNQAEHPSGIQGDGDSYGASWPNYKLIKLAPLNTTPVSGNEEKAIQLRLLVSNAEIDLGIGKDGATMSEILSRYGCPYDKKEKNIDLRFLLSSAESVAIIGKAEGRIDDIVSELASPIHLIYQNQCFPGTSDRIMMLVSVSVEKVLKVVDSIFSELMDKDVKDSQRVEFNSDGLPIRPGAKECWYYMSNGSCRYGSECRHHHPDRTPPVAGASTSQFTPEHYHPYQTPPVAGASTSQFSAEHHQYQAPATGVWFYVGPPISYPSTSSVPASTYQPPSQKKTYPQRPDQPECKYYMEKRFCKFGDRCRYHHPK